MPASTATISQKDEQGMNKLPGGGIGFDGESSSAVKRSNKIVEKSGNTGLEILRAFNEL